MFDVFPHGVVGWSAVCDRGTYFLNATKKYTTNSFVVQNCFLDIFSNSVDITIYARLYFMLLHSQACSFDFSNNKIWGNDIEINYK